MPVLESHTQVPRRFTMAFATVNRRGPALLSVARPGDQVEMAPVCLMYTCLEVEPSNRVGVAV